MSLTVNDSIHASNQLNEIDVHERDNEKVNRDGLNFMGDPKGNLDVKRI
nr:hypothetical protein [Sporosarcina sp. E16_3]